MIIKQTVVGVYQVNTYLLIHPRTREAALIDPGGDKEKLLDFIEEDGIRFRYILNTHGHGDHTGCNAEMKARLSVPICMHEADVQLFGNGVARENPEEASGDVEDILLKDGDVLPLGDLSIKVIHTPGHTPGSVCFLVDDNLFSGDTLFVGDVGRTDLQGGSMEILLKSLQEKLITLPREIIVRPGHDYGVTPTSTIGREIKENPYITDWV